MTTDYEFPGHIEELKRLALEEGLTSRATNAIYWLCFGWRAALQLSLESSAVWKDTEAVAALLKARENL